MTRPPTVCAGTLAAMALVVLGAVVSACGAGGPVYDALEDGGRTSDASCIGAGCMHASFASWIRALRSAPCRASTPSDGWAVA